MTYQTIQDFNVTNLDGIIVYVSQTIPFFIPLMMMFIWIVVSMTVYFGTRKFSGQADFLSAASAGAYLTVVLASILTLYSGIMNLTNLVYIIGILIVAFVLMWIRRNRD